MCPEMTTQGAREYSLSPVPAPLVWPQFPVWPQNNVSRHGRGGIRDAQSAETAASKPSNMVKTGDHSGSNPLVARVGDAAEDLAPIPPGMIQESVDDVFPKRDFVRLPRVEPAPKIALRKNETQKKLNDDRGGHTDCPLVNAGGAKDARESERLEEVRES